MRIVIVTSGVRGIGSYCMNLSKYLTKKGHDVLVVSETKWMKEPMDNLLEAKSRLLFGLIPLVLNPHQVLRKIRAFKPDIIHYHWPCGTFDFFFGKMRRMGIPVLITLHVAVASRKQLFDKVWYRHFSIIRRHLRRVSGVNSISRFVLHQLKSRTDLPNSRLFLIYAGVNEEIFRPAETTDSDVISLLFVGQVMPEKGIDMLIRAVERVQREKHMTLTIIGSGHLKPLLMRKTKKNSGVRWIGFLKGQKEIAAYYAKADLTVLPTHWDEAFSLVPVESLACGTPVMATKKGGTPEIVIPGKTGFLLNDCDEDKLYSALRGLDKKALRAMRKECRHAVLEQYTLSRMGKNHEELYRKLIG